jgi:hypothetical protein
LTESRNPGVREPSHPRDTPWPVRVDQHLGQGLDESDVDLWVQSADPDHTERTAGPDRGTVTESSAGAGSVVDGQEEPAMANSPATPMA